MSGGGGSVHDNIFFSMIFSAFGTVSPTGRAK